MLGKSGIPTPRYVNKYHPSVSAPDQNSRIILCDFSLEKTLTIFFL